MTLLFYTLSALAQAPLRPLFFPGQCLAQAGPAPTMLLSACGSTLTFLGNTKWSPASVLPQYKTLGYILF